MELFINHFKETPVLLWLPVCGFTLGYMVYLFSDRTRVLKAAAGRMTAFGTSQEWEVYLQKLIGFLLLGAVPFLLFLTGEGGPGTAGFVLPRGESVLWWFVVPVAVFLAIALARPKKNIPVHFYPQVRAAEWNLRRIFLNSLFWILYLAGYEFAFRGYLLFPMIAHWGFVPAAALNSSIYALAHIYKGPGEAFGAFFLGILLCVIAAATGSFVIPFILHVILALGNDLGAVSANPEMKFVL